MKRRVFLQQVGVAVGSAEWVSRAFSRDQHIPSLKSDRYTWLNPGYSPSFARSDGLPTWPLPFDDKFQPKPAYWAIVKSLESAPKRKLLERP